MKKWIGVIILVIVGIIALIVAIEYLTQPIHSLPSILGGKSALVNGHHVRGHYHKRGYAALVVAIVALGGAVLLAVRINRQGSATGGAPAAGTGIPQSEGASANTLLGGAEKPSEANSET